MANEDWRARLSDAVAKSGRSKRSISLEAGLGAGYVHSILTEGKDPTINKLVEVCNAIGASVSYILYGVEVMPEDAEILRALQSDPITRDAVLALLRARKAS
ncbi:XRE family transcriptional regulator [Thioclava sp. BHET1]|nr:XRE family transcriptional regulator [Thioclava sp. BHET1]